jgi:hypothetical protein
VKDRLITAIAEVEEVQAIALTEQMLDARVDTHVPLDACKWLPFDIVGDTLRGTRGIMGDMIRRPSKLHDALDIGFNGQGWHTSAPPSPGESVWSVKKQKLLFVLVAASLIGVSLTPRMIMLPRKSLSLILGTGRNPIGVEGASNCDFCSVKEYCRYRALRQPAAPQEKAVPVQAVA